MAFAGLATLHFDIVERWRWSEIHGGEQRRRFLDALDNDRASLPTCATCEFGAGSDFSKYQVAGQSYT